MEEEEDRETAEGNKAAADTGDGDTDPTHSKDGTDPAYSKDGTDPAHNEEASKSEAGEPLPDSEGVGPEQERPQEDKGQEEEATPAAEKEVLHLSK